MRTIALRGPRGPRGLPGEAGAPGGGYSPQHQAFTGDGSARTFTLDVAVPGALRKAFLAFIDGQKMFLTDNAPASASEYNVSGTTLTFGVAPLSGQIIECHYWT